MVGPGGVGPTPALCVSPPAHQVLIKYQQDVSEHARALRVHRGPWEAGLGQLVGRQLRTWAPGVEGSSRGLSLALWDAAVRVDRVSTEGN